MTTTNSYLSYINDQHLLDCISNLYDKYKASRLEITESKFFKNKVDIFKAQFDAQFTGSTESQILEKELTRQIDKSVNNHIGYFHEEVLGGVDGFEQGSVKQADPGETTGYDLKASDNSLFAEIKNKFNTANYSNMAAIYQKLQRFADDYRGSNCYYVQILAKKSSLKPWKQRLEKTYYNHPNVFIASGDQFYELITGEKDALFQLYKVLPEAIKDFLSSLNADLEKTKPKFLLDLDKSALEGNRATFEEVALKNFRHYSGFSSMDS